MTIRIYQCYYDDSQIPQLSPSFIPYDNTSNEFSEYREYVLWRRLYRKHIGTDDYWGIVSWRWPEKTRIEGQVFKNWILDNPGYDVYFFDPSLETIGHRNLGLQGDQWHPGIVDYCNRLLHKLNIKIDMRNVDYKAKHFAASSFFIGNSKFWYNYMTFLDECITTSRFDIELNEYLFEVRNQYNGASIPNFCFVIERMFSLFYYLNHDLKFHKFPVEHECYPAKHGDMYPQYLQIYKSKE
jgi:hypothetical protein